MEDIRTMERCALSDGVLKVRLADIITRLGLTTVVETGVDYGGSTYQFSRMAEKVIGIDNDATKIRLARNALHLAGANNVTLLCMNSPDGLRHLLEEGLDASHTLFMLDAHWQKYWPLKDEIRTLPKGQGVIVVHDCRVPGVPQLGVDAYEGTELSYDYLQDVLTEWSPQHVIEYNDNTATGSRRGVMFVYANLIDKVAA